MTLIHLQKAKNFSPRLVSEPFIWSVSLRLGWEECHTAPPWQVCLSKAAEWRTFHCVSPDPRHMLDGERSSADTEDSPMQAISCPRRISQYWHSPSRYVLTYNDIMLSQNRHFPQGLVGEAVEVVRAILPLAPALLPASLHQLIWEHRDHDKTSPGKLYHSGPITITTHCNKQRSWALSIAAFYLSFPATGALQNPVVGFLRSRISTWEVLYQSHRFGGAGLVLVGGARWVTH